MNQSAENLRSPWYRIALYWLAVAVWLALIFFFSAQSNLSTNLGAWDIVLRKAAHMAEFAALCFLLWRAIREHGAARGKALAVAAVFSAIYAASDEFHQSFVPGRTATIRDVAIDCGGILITVIVLQLIFRSHRFKHVIP